jgi:hypothetical protein
MGPSIGVSEGPHGGEQFEEGGTLSGSAILSVLGAGGHSGCGDRAAGRPDCGSGLPVDGRKAHRCDGDGRDSRDALNSHDCDPV